MGAIGFPELMVVFLIVAIWLIPIAAAIWVISTLKRIRTAQEAMAARLEEMAAARRD